MSIRKRKLTYGYCWQVQWRDRDGRQHSKHFAKKADAENFDAGVRTRRAAGGVGLPTGHAVTFRDFVAQFQSLRRDMDLSITTRRRQEGIIKNHFLPHLGDTKMSEIRFSDMAKLVKQWSDDGLAPNTLIQHRQVLSQIFDLAVRDDVILKNPTKGLKLPTPLPAVHHILTAEETGKLLSSLEEPHRTVVATFLFTGMRFDELQHLDWSDINLDENWIRVRVSKTEAGKRLIHIDPSQSAMLRRHKERISASFGELPHVFTSPKGARLNYGNFTKRILIPTVERIGLSDVRAHDFRRTHATVLSESDVTEMTLARRMGHTSSSTTKKYYIRPTDNSQQRAAHVMARFSPHLGLGAAPPRKAGSSKIRTARRPKSRYLLRA